MKHFILSVLIVLFFGEDIQSQTRSGNYGHPVYWFNRYKHKIPVVNQIPARPGITIGGVLDAVTDRPDIVYREPSVEEVYKEYLTLDSLTQDSLKNVLHPNWSQPMFNRSQSAVYATYKYQSQK
jgi:hypothetical protein